MDAVDQTKICYWKQHMVGEGKEWDEWWFYMPGCGLGRLAKHQVTEHEDGSITASPSILLEGHWDGKPMTKHGYLERGVWRDA